jgi:hypothetical protein
MQVTKSLSKTQQKIHKPKKHDENLTTEEEAVVQRVLSGKEKLFKFNNVEDAISFLHKKPSKK